MTEKRRGDQGCNDNILITPLDKGLSYTSDYDYFAQSKAAGPQVEDANKQSEQKEVCI